MADRRLYPWWPMVDPPLPGPDAMRAICEHGWTDESCYRDPTHAGERSWDDLERYLLDETVIEQYHRHVTHKEEKREKGN